MLFSDVVLMWCIRLEKIVVNIVVIIISFVVGREKFGFVVEI